MSVRTKQGADHAGLASFVRDFVLLSSVFIRPGGGGRRSLFPPDAASRESPQTFRSWRRVAEGVPFRRCVPLTHSQLTHSQLPPSLDRRRAAREGALPRRAVLRLDGLLGPRPVHRLQQQDVCVRRRGPLAEVVRRVRGLEDVDAGRRVRDQGGDGRDPRERLRGGQVHGPLRRRLRREQGRLQGHLEERGRPLGQARRTLGGQARRRRGRQREGRLLHHRERRQVDRVRQVPFCRVRLLGPRPAPGEQGRRERPPALAVLPRRGRAFPAFPAFPAGRPRPRRAVRRVRRPSERRRVRVLQVRRDEHARVQLRRAAGSGREGRVCRVQQLRGVRRVVVLLRGGRASAAGGPAAAGRPRPRPRRAVRRPS